MRCELTTVIDIWQHKRATNVHLINTSFQAVDSLTHRIWERGWLNHHRLDFLHVKLTLKRKNYCFSFCCKKLSYQIYPKFIEGGNIDSVRLDMDVVRAINPRGRLPAITHAHLHHYYGNVTLLYWHHLPSLFVFFYYYWCSFFSIVDCICNKSLKNT